MTGKMIAATFLMPIGVALVAATAETGVLWWAVIGYLALLFVPALISDAVADRIKEGR